VKEHYEENESDFNSCPSVNFVNMVRERHHSIASSSVFVGWGQQHPACCAEIVAIAFA
jgi:hypothetical protein